MNINKSTEILKRIIISYHELRVFEEKSRAIGIEIEDSAVNDAMSNLSKCVCIMFGIEISNMIGDDILDIMSNGELNELQIYEKLIDLLGIESLNQ